MESITTLSGFLGINPLLIAAVILWTLVWKGLALWKSAGLRQKGWFIALMIVNTLGILEIIYLFVISRRYKILVEVIEEKG